MPIYEYECGAGHRYEKREGFDAPSTQRCPQCRRQARRVLHAPPIVFKGSGFYVTDSRAGARSEDGASDAKPAESESPSSDVKPVSEGDSKTASKDAEPAPAG